MAIRLTESRLRQIIKEEISEMAGMLSDPAAMSAAPPVAVAPKWKKVVDRIVSFYNPDDEGWMETIPDSTMNSLCSQLGGIRAPNQMAIQRAMIKAGIPRDDAGALCDSAYSMRY